MNLLPPIQVCEEELVPPPPLPPENVNDNDVPVYARPSILRRVKNGVGSFLKGMLSGDDNGWPP